MKDADPSIIPDSASPSSPENPAPLSVESLLARPFEQRRREYQYRFAQSAVFGLPVLALQYFGPSLGGAESERWIGVLQAILTGWVTYVGAAGMLSEGLVLLASRGKFMFETVLSLVAVGLYLFSAISVLGVILHGAIFYRPLLFHVVILLIATWTGFRWWRMSRTS